MAAIYRKDLDGSTSVSNDNGKTWSVVPASSTTPTTNPMAGDGTAPVPTGSGGSYSGAMRAGTGFGFSTSTLKNNPTAFADSLSTDQIKTILSKFGYEFKNGLQANGIIRDLAVQAGTAGFSDLTSWANSQNMWNSGGAGQKKPVSPNAAQAAPPGGYGSTYVYPTTIDTTAASEQSAQVQVEQSLMTWGLDTPALVQMSWSLISDPGNHMDPGEVLNKIRESPDYQARFPGINNIIVGDGSRMTEQAYMKNENDIQMQLANAGVPTGMVDKAEIGTMIQNGIYGGTLKDRLDKGYTLLQNAPPETTKLLKDWYGVDSGHLLMHVLDPSGGMTQKIMKQTQAVLIGTASYDTGFGGPQGLSQKTAEQLAQQALADPSNMNMGTYKSGFAKIAPMQTLEQAQVGQRGQATASQQQLIELAFPGMRGGDKNSANVQQDIQRAIEARGAGLSGGGTFAAGAKGVAGAGRASTEGTGNA